MIPVDESCIVPLNLRIAGKDDAAARNYKKMGQNNWIGVSTIRMPL